MPLVRFQVKNEYGLGDPELYRGAVKREDPKAVLDGVAVAGLVGILRQLGDLAEFAADIFHDLHEQVIATSARGRRVMTRVRNIEAALPSLEKAIRGQTSHVHLAYIPGCEWHARVRTEKNHLLSSDLPRFMMDSYEECRDPPRLYLLDKFDNGGHGACLKRYSDPTFFEKAWDMLSKVKNAENAHREKKHHKIKRKGSRNRNGELHNAAGTSRLRNGALPDMLIPSQHNSQRFTSPSSDTHSFSDNRSVPDMRSNPDMISRSTSLGSKSKFNLADQVTNPDQVADPSSSSSVKHEEEANGYYYYPNGASISAPLSPPRSVTWDEKMAIVATTSSSYCDDVIMDRVRDVVAPISVNPNLSPDSRKLPLPLSLVTVNRDEAVHETENYVDALNTLESETDTETETECRTTKCSETIVKKPVSDDSSEPPQVVAPSDDLLVSQRLETGNGNGNGNASMRQHESPRNSGYASSEVCEINAASQNNGNISIREPESPEISEIALPEISSLVLNEDSLVNNSQETNFQTTLDYSHDEEPREYSKIAPAEVWDHSLDPIEEPYLENFPKAKIKGKNASRRYEYPQYSEIPPLMQSDIEKGENGIIDYPRRSVEEPRVSSTITAESFENEMQTSFSDERAIHSKGVHDTTTTMDESSNLEKVSSAKLWTNAGLFGLEPSKPPVCIPNSNLSEEVDKPVPGNSMKNSSPIHENKCNNGTANLSSNFSSLAQRFLTNTLQKRISSPPPPPPLSYPEPAPHVSSVDSHAKRSLQASPSRNSTGQSSPPLEFMKISFNHPMNGNPNSNLDEGTDFDAVFPDFQILPGPTCQPGGDDSGSESDEDTFCRSYAYSSEDLLSPRLFSNSDVWDPDENILPEYSEKIPTPNYMGFEQAADLHGIETVSNLNTNLNFVLENENQMPPPPPLPPVQWRLGKHPGSSMGDTNGDQVPHQHGHVGPPEPPSVPDLLFQPKLSRKEEKPERNREVNQTLMKEMKVEGEVINWNQKMDNKPNLNGHEKPKKDALPKKDAFDCKDLEEREDMLYQIRNKSFNLRRTVKSNPEPDSSETPTNSSVSAIIEKANAIRQAFVGSDDGCDDDSWSDI